MADSESPDRLFPTLTPKQAARIAAHGRRRATTRGEVLVAAGDRAAPFFLVVTGALEATRPGDSAETLIVTLEAGQFSGEGNMITGRRALVALRVSMAGEVIELNREQLLAFIQTDAELSETLMLAFILRRLRLIERDLGDVVVVGSAHSAGTLRAQRLPEAERPPVSLCRSRPRSGGAGTARSVSDRRRRHSGRHLPRDAVLRNPTNAQIADCLGFNEEIDRSGVSDLVIVGGGPAGLAAAVYGASEGLNVLRARSERAGRTGRVQLTHRELPGLSDGHLGAGPHGPRVRPGAEIRRKGHGGEGCNTTGL